jgi:hypothetical protein
VTRLEIVGFLNIVSYFHLSRRPQGRLDLREPIKNDVHELISVIKVALGRKPDG